MDALKQGADSLFILLGGIMVLAMHAGFAFLELGTVRKKNQVNALVKILVDFSVSTVAYFLAGYGVAYGVSFWVGAEVLSAVSEWLDTAIKPLVSGRGKFDLAVARNALGIVAREIALRPAATDAALAADLLDGKADLATPGLLARLRRMALDKLSADVPKYPALALARARWEGN